MPKTDLFRISFFLTVSALATLATRINESKANRRSAARKLKCWLLDRRQSYFVYRVLSCKNLSVDVGSKGHES